MVPLHFFKAFDEDRGALNIFATWLTSDCMRVVWKRSAYLSRLDEGISVFLYSFLGIFDGLEHDKSVVELLEKWPLDANLARANILLKVVTEIQV